MKFSFMIFAPIQCGFLYSFPPVLYFVLFCSIVIVIVYCIVVVSFVVLFLIFCSVDADGNDVDVR